MKSGRVVFLDRDGVINEEVGYLNHLDRLRLLPRSAEGIALLNRAGWHVVVVTNQSGVATGYFPESLIAEVHAEMQRRLEAAGARIDAFYYCPHHPTIGEPPYRCACDCRKPRTGLLRRAAADLGLRLEGSCIISDRYRDLTMAAEIGATGILVLTGYGTGEYAWWRQSRGWAAQHVAHDLLQAARWFLERQAHQRQPARRLSSQEPR